MGWVHDVQGRNQGQSIVFKKYFRPTKVFKLSELKDVKTMSFTNAKHIQISSDGVRARRDTYNWVTLEKDGVKEKFMIIGYNFFLGDEPVDSEQILKEIAAENKNNWDRVRPTWDKLRPI